MVFHFAFISSMNWICFITSFGWQHGPQSTSSNVFFGVKTDAFLKPHSTVQLHSKNMLYGAWFFADRASDPGAAANQNRLASISGGPLLWPLLVPPLLPRCRSEWSFPSPRPDGTDDGITCLAAISPSSDRSTVVLPSSLIGPWSPLNRTLISRRFW